MSCSVCDGKTRDDPCNRCVRRLLEAIRSLPGLLAELEITVTRQSRIDSPTKHGKGDSQPLPFNWTASELTRPALRTLDRWCVEYTPWYLGGRKLHLETMCRVLAAADLRSSPRVAVCHRQITELAQRIGRAIDRVRVDDIFMGRCTRMEIKWLRETDLITYAPCGTDLYSDGGLETKCEKCGAVYSTRLQRRKLLRAASDQLARPSVIAEALIAQEIPVKASRIDNWVSRGRLLPHGVDSTGKRLFRVGDVLALLGVEL